jgi:intein/homing endonuclease
MKLLKDNWFTILIVAVLVYILIESDLKIKRLIEKKKELELVIEKAKVKEQLLLITIDSLNSIEFDVIKEIETIKEKEYVQIKVVDSIPVSKLQDFFTEQYPDN